MALCGCVPGAALGAVNNRATTQNFGEIQKILIQRTYNGTVLNSIVVGTTDPALKATWTPRLAAADDTKVVTTPYIGGLKNEAGDAITFGGNGETVGGIEANIGKNTNKFEGNFHGAWQTTMAALEAYNCESISVFFVNECGAIAGLSDNPTNPTTFRGIPVAPNTWFIGDKMFGGKTALDANKLMFQFLPNATKNFTVIQPSDFNPLDDADFNPIV